MNSYILSAGSFYLLSSKITIMAMIGDRSYEEKRNMDETPEPSSSGSKKSSGNHPIFVIQKHDASNLHYDFRLEIEGALKSWVLPKGPSTDPSQKRLAIPTENHPMDYADFEGVIPEDEYGAGPVMVWDCGTFTEWTADNKLRHPRIFGTA